MIPYDKPPAYNPEMAQAQGQQAHQSMPVVQAYAIAEGNVAPSAGYQHPQHGGYPPQGHYADRPPGGYCPPPQHPYPQGMSPGPMGPGFPPQQQPPHRPHPQHPPPHPPPPQPHHETDAYDVDHMGHFCCFLGLTCLGGIGVLWLPVWVAACFGCCCQSPCGRPGCRNCCNSS